MTEPQRGSHNANSTFHAAVTAENIRHCCERINEDMTLERLDVTTPKCDFYSGKRTALAIRPMNSEFPLEESP